MTKRPKQSKLDKEAFSAWAHPRNQSLSVTRGELVTILYNLKKQWDEDRWYNKLGRWLQFGWLPKRGLRVDGGTPGETQPAKPQLLP